MPDSTRSNKGVPLSAEGKEKLQKRINDMDKKKDAVDAERDLARAATKKLR